MTLEEHLNTLRGKRVIVVGAGISNRPLIEALLGAGIETIVCDRQSREEMGEIASRLENVGASLRLGDDYLENLNADIIFRTPSLMPWSKALEKAVRHGAVLTSEMEAFFDVCPCKIIAVTGSDGKTTTSSIIAELLTREGKTIHLGGNIGAPLLCDVDKMHPDDLAIVELSSFQLITMKKSPHIAVVTNISPNHLDIHTGFEEYIDAKRNICIHQDNTDRVVLNLDNDLTRGFLKSAPGEVLLFSRLKKVRDGVYEKDGMIYETTDDKSVAIMPSGDILLPGTHNIENFMAAFAAVRGIVGYDAMAETARSFRGVAHRIELVREVRGVRYYNDSIASSPSRAIAGLRSFDQKVILIAGGKDKGIEFDELGIEIVRRVKTLVLTGVTAERIRDAVVNAPGYAEMPKILMRDDFTEAVLAATELATDGDIVLLSPACTSFDKFKNFEERGELFREIVMRPES